MTVYAYTRGHKIEWDEAAEVWRYADTGEPVSKAAGGIWEGMAGDRPCAYCHQMPTAEGHDACLGELPGVKYACCGHGVEHEGGAFQGYIFYEKWPLWMTNKNRWPVVIAVLGGLPWVLFTLWIAYGLVAIPEFWAADYSGWWMLAAATAAVSLGAAFAIYSRQWETTEFLRKRRSAALISALEVE